MPKMGMGILVVDADHALSYIVDGSRRRNAFRQKTRTPRTLILKIQKLTEENRAKVYALLRSAFPGNEYQAELLRKLHLNDRPLHEWVCLHSNKAIAYIAFSTAYHGREACGLHLAPMAVAPEFQRKGVGSELLGFALRQEAIKSQPLFVFGKPDYFKRFGFEACSLPMCPFGSNNSQFLCLRNQSADHFIVGYEPEFDAAVKQAKPPAKPQKRRR
jgi:putative acetyltransferase